MSDELKPCNYCEDGGELRIVKDGLFYVVGCNECGYMTGAYCTRESAIAAWNARAEQRGQSVGDEIKIGNEVYVHGYVDEIRSDTVIIRNDGGYFGTAPHEVVPDAANVCADDAGELPTDDACAILRKNLYDVSDLGRAMGILEPNELVGGSGDRAYIFERLADLIERDYVRRDSIVDDAHECEIVQLYHVPVAGIDNCYNDAFICSECEAEMFEHYAYCPSCGAKVRKAEPPEWTVDNAQADSREKLEADVRRYANPNGCEGTLGARWEEKMLEFLDRQAAITEAENEERECTIVGAWDDYATELEDERDELREQVDKLTAELRECDENRIEYRDQRDYLEAEAEAQRKRANDAERGVLSAEWYVCRDRYEDDVFELQQQVDGLTDQLDKANETGDKLLNKLIDMTTERDYWKDQVLKCVAVAVKPGGYKAGVMHYPRPDGFCEPSLLVTDAIDNLKDFYADEMRVNGKLVAMRDELRDFAAEKIAELVEKQRVIDVQRESFRKMEKDCADMSKALDKACAEVMERSGSCPYDVYDVQPVDCADKCTSEPAGCWRLYFEGVRHGEEGSEG